jgi:hypothetical protein
MNAQPVPQTRRRHVTLQLDTGAHPLGESLLLEALRALSPTLTVAADEARRRLEIWVAEDERLLLPAIMRTIHRYGYRVEAGHFD